MTVTIDFFFFTISIHIIVTCISKTILVCVPLVGILDQTAIVTCITMEILITVFLVWVWCQPAVILQGGAMNRENSNSKISKANGSLHTRI